jgi:hypothetical protein
MKAKTSMLKERKTSALLILFGIIAMILSAGYMYLISGFPNMIDLEQGLNIIVVHILLIAAVIGAIGIANLWFALFNSAELMVIKNKIDAIEELAEGIALECSGDKKEDK